MNDLFENSLADSLGKLAAAAPAGPDARKILAALGRRKVRRIGWAGYRNWNLLASNLTARSRGTSIPSFLPSDRRLIAM